MWSESNRWRCDLHVIASEDSIGISEQTHVLHSKMLLFFFLVIRFWVSAMPIPDLLSFPVNYFSLPSLSVLLNSFNSFTLYPFFGFHLVLYLTYLHYLYFSISLSLSSPLPLPPFLYTWLPLSLTPSHPPVVHPSLPSLLLSTNMFID